MFVVYRFLLIIFAASASFSIFAWSAEKWMLVGGCDQSGECTAHINGGLPERDILCGSDDLSAIWRRGAERFLIQCGSSSTAEEGTIWIVDESENVFKKINFGRFVTRKFLVESDVVMMPDKFGPKYLCHSIDGGKLDSSDFIVFEKKPTSGDRGSYCYDPIYLVIKGGALLIGRSSEGGSAMSSLESKVASKDERLIIISLLDALRHWGSR